MVTNTPNEYLKREGNNMSVNVAEVFGSDVFNEAVMKERLPKDTYKQLMDLMKLKSMMNLYIYFLL